MGSNSVQIRPGPPRPGTPRAREPELPEYPTPGAAGPADLRRPRPRCAPRSTERPRRRQRRTRRRRRPRRTAPRGPSPAPRRRHHRLNGTKRRAGTSSHVNDDLYERALPPFVWGPPQPPETSGLVEDRAMDHQMPDTSRHERSAVARCPLRREGPRQSCRCTMGSRATLLVRPPRAASLLWLGGFPRTLPTEWLVGFGALSPPR